MRPAFARRVLAIVRRVPVGRIVSYGEVAAAAGSPRASRAVGNILRTCNEPGAPCHRVVGAQGRLGGFGGDLALKRQLLRAEGIVVFGSRIRNWRERQWLVTGAGAQASTRAPAKPTRRPRGRKAGLD